MTLSSHAFGKTMGNGYAITAVVGTRAVMEAAQNTFISSTFWTERIGPSAALKTLKIMKRVKSWEIIAQKGKKVQDGWIRISKKYNIPVTCSAIPSVSSFKINSKNHLKYKTFITQEMLKKGFLAGTAVYTSMAHSKDKLNNYYDSLNDVFRLISKYYHDDEIDLLSLHKNHLPDT